MSILRSRLVWRLYAGYVAVILPTTVVLGLLIGWRLDRDARRDLEESLHSKALLLGDLAEHGGAGGRVLESRVRELGREISTRLTVVRADGVVAADSEEEPSRMDNHANRPEIAESRDRGIGVSTRWSHTLRVDMMYLAIPIRREGRVVGYVRAALPLTAVRDRLAHVRNLVLLGVLLATVGGLVLGFIFARSVTRPLSVLTEAAEVIAAGSPGRDVPTDAPAEIGKLAAAFIRMTGRLDERMEAVSRGRSQLAAILGGMVEGVVAVDREGRVLHMNEVAAAMFGCSADSSAGKPLWEATRIPAVLDILKTAPGEAEVSTREIRLPEGMKDRVIEVRASPLSDAHGHPGGLVIVLHDITDLRRLETVRRDFVANVSHELKTPVTAIRGLAETLLDDPGMDAATHRDFLVKVRDQATRLGRLVGDLLTLSRVEAGEGALEREPLDLREPVRDSARVFEGAARAKGLEFVSEITREPVQVRGDREALRQVADNLLDNAVKYTPQGGRVLVRLRPDAGWAVLEVTDTGPGIAPEHVGRIFERFYRVDKARSRELGGTGLGLSIVRHVALAHGGQASVESNVGQGSTFRVRLPIAPA